MNRQNSLVAAAIAAVMCGFGGALAADSPSQSRALKPVSAFAGIREERARSLAIFTEAGKVLQNPRCLNCHPVTRRPTQGDDLHAHVPLMNAGAGVGVAGLPCRSCHGAANVTTLASSIQSIPGNPRWSLAPASMAWQTKSLAEICTQIKDTTRNGGRELADIHEHVSQDPLVGWAWHPGAGRVPAPGTQAEFGKLIEAWIATGAQCPAK